MILSVRNVFIVFLVVALHVTLLWRLATAQPLIEPAQVLVVTLQGTLVAPSAAAAEPASSSTQLASADEAMPIEESVVEPVPVEEPEPEPEPVPEPEPIPIPVPVIEEQAEVQRPPERRQRVERRHRPPEAQREHRTRNRPTETRKPVEQPSSPAQTVSEVASSATQGSAGASLTAPTNSVAQGDPNGEQNAVTKPSLRASYLNNPKPPYPPMSRRMKEQGRVVLRVLVSAQGTAKQVEIKKSSGYSRLDQSALKTVQGWRFVPAKRAGVAIDMWYDVPVDFALNS